MWTALLAMAIAFVCGGAGGFWVAWTYTRALRSIINAATYDIAVLEDRLVREVKRRVAQDRWDRGEPTAPDVEKLTTELKHGLLPPDEFIRRKQRMIYGTGQVPGQSS